MSHWRLRQLRRARAALVEAVQQIDWAMEREDYSSFDRECRMHFADRDMRLALRICANAAKAFEKERGE